VCFLDNCLLRFIDFFLLMILRTFLTLKYWDMVLTNNLCYQFTHFPLTAGSAALATVPVHCKLGSMHLVLCIAVNLVFYWPYLKKMLEVGSFSSQTCVTAKQKNLLIAH